MNAQDKKEQADLSQPPLPVLIFRASWGASRFIKAVVAVSPSRDELLESAINRVSFSASDLDEKFSVFSRRADEIVESVEKIILREWEETADVHPPIERRNIKHRDDCLQKMTASGADKLQAAWKLFFLADRGRDFHVFFCRDSAIGVDPAVVLMSTDRTLARIAEAALKKMETIAKEVFGDERFLFSKTIDSKDGLDFNQVIAQQLEAVALREVARQSSAKARAAAPGNEEEAGAAPATARRI